jgi:signal transduction histidine kinase
LCAAILGITVLSRGSARVNLEPRPFASGSFTSAPVNALGNAEDDLVLLSTRALLMARLMEGEFRTLWQYNFDSRIQLAPAMDVDGDGLDEICVATRDSAGAWAEVFSRAGARMARLGPMRDSLLVPPSSGECHLLPVAVLADSGGARALACLALTMEHRPRGIALYDPATANRRWFLPMGAWPEAVVATDLVASGPQQLLVGGNSTANGLDLNGTDDRHACVLALDATGRLLWRTVVAQEFAGVTLLPLAARPGRAREIVVAVRSHRAHNPEPCMLAVLDGRTGEILRRRDFPGSLGQPRLLDPTRGDFVVGCADGTLRTFDHELRQIGQYRARSAIEAWSCADLAGDGMKSVIASTNREILILDERLRLQGRHPFDAPGSGPTRLATLRAGMKSYRVLSTERSIVIFDVRRVPPLSDPRRVGGVLAGGLLCGVAAAALWPAGRRGRLPSVRESRDFLVDYRQVRHDIFDEVRPFGALWNWAHEAVADAPLPRAAFESARDQFTMIGRGTLDRFIARAGTLQVDGECVERMRGLLRELESLLHQPVQGPRQELAERARRAARTMRALSDACAAAYRQVAEREPCRVDRAVQDALRAKQAGLAQRGVAVHSFVGAGAGVPVLFDSGELRELIGQLLENALAALAGVPDPELHVNVRLDPLDCRHVVVRVMDNGPGIAAGLRETVFQPDHSSRPGGGFGLGHAREVARAWRSDLVIDDPPEGRGAVLRLMLAVLFPFEEGRTDAAGADRPQPVGSRPEGAA